MHSNPMEIIMSERIEHECSVSAIYWMDEAVAPEGDASSMVSNNNITPMLQQMLCDQQNRGQLAAGITTYDPDRPQILDTYKDVGSVNEVFRVSHPGKFQAILKEYAGRAGIGHTRYATCGQEDPRYAQPFERHHGRLWKWFSFAFNGTLANYPELREQLLSKQGYHITLEGDTEIMMHTLSYALRGETEPSFVDVMRNVYTQFDGAYNIAFINGCGEMFVARDPLGLRPLCWAVQGRLFAAASESIALRNMGFRDINHLEPGTMVIVNSKGYKVERYADPVPQKRCFFEWIYFANAASEIDNLGVYQAREAAGRILGKNEDNVGILQGGEDVIVVPVPDTAKAAAAGYAHVRHLPCLEGLMRNRYAGRTFIQSNTGRSYAVRSKYAVLPTVLGGKKVVLVDDSIVRSTTIRALMKMLREVGGAAEVHLRIACPPIIAPCFYGVDMSLLGDLFAPHFLEDGYKGEFTPDVLDRMAKDLGADSLRYLPVDNIGTSIGCGQDTFCLGCCTREFPTPKGNELFEKSLKIFQEHKKVDRVYD